MTDAQIAQAQRLVAMAQAHLRSLLLEALAEAHGIDCAYCRVPTLVDPPAGLRYRERTLDHVIPLSRGGADELSNVVLCCRSCNSRKGARPVRQYAVWKDAR
jgi:5-methylcytosine-specific restriction endonuclease McrA